VIQIDDTDEKISKWAVKHTPVFGSEEDAREASDIMLSATGAAYAATALATPGGDDPKKWTEAKAKGVAVGMTGLLTSQVATNYLKGETNRKRPDHAGDKSFPSMHTSRAASQAALASRNLDSIDMPENARYAFRAGFIGLAAGTAWARVEGRRHYLGDVLAGYSLGHFISAFINDAFLGIKSSEEPGLILEAVKDELIVGIGWAF
jgi:hypothetical protein